MSNSKELFVFHSQSPNRAKEKMASHAARLSTGKIGGPDERRETLVESNNMYSTATPGLPRNTQRLSRLLIGCILPGIR